MPELTKAPFMKYASMLSKDPLGFMDKLVETYGDFILYNGGLFKFYMINDADLVRDVLKQTNENYDKQSKFYSRFTLIGRSGLITSEGEHWQRQRRMMNPFFTQRSIKDFYSNIETANKNLEKIWIQKSETGEIFNICDDMFTLSLDIIGNALFNLELPSFQEDIKRWSETIFEFLLKIPVPILSELWFPSPINLKLKKALREFDGLCSKIIESRRQERDPPNDFLQKLLSAKDAESGSAMSDQEIVEELLSFILAGHETTSHTLSWTWYWLSMNPDAYQKVEDELGRLSLEDYPDFSRMVELRYTTAAIKETLRMTPILSVLTRRATKDTELGGVKLKKDDMVLICFHCLHRNQKYWVSPEKYMPERFLDEEQEKRRNKNAYLPFGGGPRFCIGNNLAMLEMVYSMAYIMKRFRVMAIEPEKCVPLALGTLQIKDGMRVRVERK